MVPGRTTERREPVGLPGGRLDDRPTVLTALAGSQAVVHDADMNETVRRHRAARLLSVLTALVLLAPTVGIAEAKGGATTGSVSYTFKRATSPARTLVYDATGHWVATFTDGARSVTIAGASRTFTEATNTTATVTTTTWVRLLASPFSGTVDAAWLTARRSDTSRDLLAIAVTEQSAGITVTAEVVEHTKGPKIRILHYKNKTGYRRRQGHRAQLTKVRVTDIAGGQVLVTGTLNLRRFEKRENETLVAAELLDRQVTLLDTGETAGRHWGVERRYPGRPLAAALPDARGASRRRLIEAALDATAALGDLTLAPRPWFGDLIGAEPVRSDTFAGWLLARGQKRSYFHHRFLDAFHRVVQLLDGRFRLEGSRAYAGQRGLRCTGTRRQPRRIERQRYRIEVRATGHRLVLAFRFTQSIVRIQLELVPPVLVLNSPQRVKFFRVQRNAVERAVRDHALLGQP